MTKTILICPECTESLSYVDTELRCNNCSFASTRGADNFFDMRDKRPDQTKGLSSDMEDDFMSNDRFAEFLFRWQDERILEAFERSKPDTVLDIGCGSGNLFNQAGGHLNMFCGMDPSDLKGLSGLPPDRAFLIHNEVSKPFMVKDESVDMAAMISSYDHLPDPEPVMRDLWSKVKPGGRMLLTMTNYGFWLKALLNTITGKRLFLNEHEHFCVHSPRTMIAELKGFFGEFEVESVAANGGYLPNLPKTLACLYFSHTWLRLLNGIVRFLIETILQQKERGSIFVLVIRKKGEPGGIG